LVWAAKQSYNKLTRWHIVASVALNIAEQMLPKEYRTLLGSFESHELLFSVDKVHVNDGDELKVAFHIKHFIEDQSTYWFGTFPKNAGVGEWDIYQMVEEPSGVYSITVCTSGRNGAWQIRFYRDGGMYNTKSN
jgi:hypothetical protein